MTMYPFGLDDTGNVSVAALHYTAPALVLLYFIFASSAATNTVTPAAESSNSASGSESLPLVRAQQYQHSSLLKWVFVLAVLTFVRQLQGIVLIYLGCRWSCSNCSCAH
jgi:hypothetical protein